jgi:hypothetical protein
LATSSKNHFTLNAVQKEKLEGLILAFVENQPWLKVIFNHAIMNYPTFDVNELTGQQLRAITDNRELKKLSTSVFPLVHGSRILMSKMEITGIFIFDVAEMLSSMKNKANAAHAPKTSNTIAATTVNIPSTPLSATYVIPSHQPSLIPDLPVIVQKTMPSCGHFNEAAFEKETMMGVDVSDDFDACSNELPQLPFAPEEEIHNAEVTPHSIACDWLSDFFQRNAQILSTLTEQEFVNMSRLMMSIHGEKFASAHDDESEIDAEEANLSVNDGESEKDECG